MQFKAAPDYPARWIGATGNVEFLLQVQVMWNSDQGSSLHLSVAALG